MFIRAMEQAVFFQHFTSLGDQETFLVDLGATSRNFGSLTSIHLLNHTSARTILETQTNSVPLGLQGIH